MLSLRAPLFSVSLAFALGCLLGLDGWISLRVALVALAVTGAAWWPLARFERASLAAFYVFAACAGLAHTLLLGSTIAVDDLRRLPDEKSLDSTQWRGVIVEEPVVQLPAHPSRRTLDRTSFLVAVEAWRPTGGRRFGAVIDTPWQPARGRVQCMVVGPSGKLQCGDRLEWAGALAPVAPPLCPGELDYRAMEAAQGVYYHATLPPADWNPTATGAGGWWQNLPFVARDWAYRRLQIGLEDDPRMANLLAGMLIGYRQEIPLDIEQDFRRTGTLHVFAVSGQKIADIFIVGMILLQLSGLIRWRWAWLLAPLMLIYCLLTGAPASAVRATVMALTVLAALRLGRPFNALGCWALAFLAMLVWNPATLLDPGAQLSFGVVLGLILIAPPLMRWLVRPLAPDPFLPRTLVSNVQKWEEIGWRWLGMLAAASLVAMVVSAPIVMIDFHQLTPVLVFANLIVVPLSGLITIVGAIGVAVSLLNTQLAALINNSNWLLTKLLILFVGFLAHKPGAAINVPDLRAFSSPTPSFIAAPLQDSACLLVRAGGRAWLFNTGREQLARAATWHLLQFYGVNRLDGLVLAELSEPDNGGMEVIARDYRPRQFIVPLLGTRSPMEKLVPDAAAMSGTSLESWRRGQSLELAPGVSVEVLHPAPDSPETLAGDRALALLFHAGGQTLLWAGRLGPQAQADVLAACPGLHADVLVMGTEPPPSRDWLRALGVRYWLQIPPRDPRANSAISPADFADLCQVWPLDETGAVDVHFDPARDGEPPKILLRPWLAAPSAR
ncbi:MAG: ComEC/Rec2 family competence protein [Methylacidiphilales bacterium]|nr:ComEC/Rec2 family competence protein [Candidatus Methylacidiphilales bacterium]